MTHREEAGRRTPWVWLALATPVVAAACVVEPRIATNRPSYGFRETMIVLTAALAVPCVLAIGQLWRRPSGAASWSTRARRWLWSAVIAFAALPLALTAAGAIVAFPSSYPDDKIPGLAAGLMSATVAVILAIATGSWMALGRLVTLTRRSRPTTTSTAEPRGQS